MRVELKDGTVLTGTVRELCTGYSGVHVMEIDAKDIKMLLAFVGNPRLLRATLAQLLARFDEERVPKPKQCAHDWQTDPGSPLVDVCSKCGEERA